MAIQKSQITIYRAEQVPGFMSRKELEWLCQTAAQLPENATWGELGCLCGRSLLAVGLSLPSNSRLVSIDHYWGSLIRAGVTAHQIFQELVTSRRDLQLEAIRADACEVTRQMANSSFDVVFIDADHRYEAVKACIQSWLPLVKPRGLICGHDYCDAWPGVIQAVDELLGQTDLCGSIWLKRVD